MSVHEAYEALREGIDRNRTAHAGLLVQRTIAVQTILDALAIALAAGEPSTRSVADARDMILELFDKNNSGKVVDFS